MFRKWHRKQKKPLLGAKSLGRLFYQNNLPNMGIMLNFDRISRMHPGVKAGCILLCLGAFSGGGVHVLFEGRLEEVLIP